MKGLTPRQAEVLEVIRSLTEKRGVPPTLRELGNVLGIASTNAVALLVAALVAKGEVDKMPTKARGLVVRRRKPPPPGAEEIALRAAALQALSALQRGGAEEARRLLASVLENSSSQSDMKPKENT